MPTFSLPKQPLPNKNSHCQNSHCQNSHCQNSHCQTTGQKLLSALCRFWTRNPCLSFFRWCLGRASSTTPPAWVRMVPPCTILLYLFNCSLFQLTMCHQRRHQRECGWHFHEWAWWGVWFASRNCRENEDENVFGVQRHGIFARARFWPTYMVNKIYKKRPSVKKCDC